MPPLLGLTLDEARTSWFFEWFHLQPTEAERPGEGKLVRFLPRGAAFRHLVAVDVGLDRSGRIRALSLGLDRQFVDEPPDAAWAREIAQAFLRAAIPGPPEAVLALAEELGGPVPPGSLPDPGEAPPAAWSPALEVFLGERAEWQLDPGPARVWLRNVHVGAEQWLVITAEGQP